MRVLGRRVGWGGYNGTHRKPPYKDAGGADEDESGGVEEDGADGRRWFGAGGC